MGSELWTRISPNNPCPLCHGTTDCRINKEGGAHCRRTSPDSPPGGWHFAKTDTIGFHVFYPDDSDFVPSSARRGSRRPPSPIRASPPPSAHSDDEAAQRRFARVRNHRYPMTDGQRLALAMRLGLPPHVFDALGVQFIERAAECPGWVFEVKDGLGQLVGFNVRQNTQGNPDAREKWSVGKGGLFIPAGWETINPAAPLFLPEGASDTLTFVALGLPAVGRYSDRAGVDHLVTFLQQPAFATDPDRMIVVVGENDKKPDGKWPGRDGAIATAEKLALALGRTVYVSLPPPHAKDVRAWWHDCGKLYDAATSPATPMEYGYNLSDYLVRTATAVRPGTPVATETPAPPAPPTPSGAAAMPTDPLTGRPINYANDLVIPEWLTAPELPPTMLHPDVRAALCGCPRPRGVIQHNDSTNQTRLLYIDCRALDCPKCGVVRRRQYADTVRHHLGELPADRTIYRVICGKWDWDRVSAFIRRQRGNFVRLLVNAGPIDGFVVYTDQRPPRTRVTDEFAPGDAADHICTYCLYDLELKPKAFTTSRNWQLLKDEKTKLATGFRHVGKFSWSAATVQMVLDEHGVRDITTYSSNGRYFGWTAWQWSHPEWQRIVEDIYVGEATPILAELPDEERVRLLIDQLWGVPTAVLSPASAGP